MAFRKIEAGLVHAPVDEFIGKTGTIFYDNDLGDFRISDGQTPGGIALSFGGGGGGGNYTLPTATTTVKGGVKIDGTTITIANQVISIGTVPYSSLSGAPTIPTNTNQLTNGAGYITSSALTGYATESYVTGRGYITSSALTGLATESYVTGRGYITSSALTGYATESYVTGRGYITSSALTGLATESYVTGRGYITSSALTGYATQSYVTSQGYITSNALSGYALTSAIPTNTNQLTNGAGYITSSALTGYALTTAIPTDISDLTDTQGLLGQGGGGGGTVIRNVENSYSFSVAGDDSTLREISNGESIKFSGAGGITVTTDDEGKITITGTSVDLTGYATETYVTSQGYITSSALTGYALTTDIPTNNNELTNGAGYITSSALTGYALTTDIPTNNNELTNGAGYITSSALTGYATESYVDSKGYITGLSWNDLADKPNLAGTYSFNVAADDSTLRTIGTEETVKFVGAGGITTASDDEGKITITQGTTSSLVNGAHTVSLGSDGVLTLPNGSTIGDGEAGSGVPITTARGTILLGNLAECAGGESHFHIMKAGQQAIDLFLGDDNNYVKLPSTGGVEISSSEIGAQHYWDFGTDGVLTLPTGGSIYGLNIIGGEGTNVQADQTTEQVYIRSYNTSSFATHEWTFGTDGSLTFPDSTVQTTAWTGVADYNNLINKPNLAGTYTWSIAADDSTQLEISAGALVQFKGAGGITTTSDSDGNITITGSTGIVTSATAPADPLAKQWYNSTDGRTYVKYNDLWVDANPPVVPQVSTYLDGLVVEGTTITTVSYVDTDIKIHDLTFKDTGVIQLPEGGDIVDNEGNSVLVNASAIPTNNNQLTNGAGYITTALNANGTLSLPILSAEPSNLQAGQIALANGTTWDPLAKNDEKPYMAIYTGSVWIDIGGLTRTDVYTQILELG
jgi:hypothetical protein